MSENFALIITNIKSIKYESKVKQKYAQRNLEQ